MDIIQDKQKILFVDDEPSIISGFKRILRKYRNQWELDFANSGDHAMDMLSQKQYDIVVSDMRMPGMDGVELLNRIKENYPETVRIVVSGHADMEMLLESARVAHQFIAKPVSSEMLLGKIERSLVLRVLLNSQKLRELASSIGELPTLPDVYEELVACIRNDNVSLTEIGEIVEKDPAMSAKMLQMVNSAFFGLAREVVSAADAASLLGIDTIKQLVLVIKVFESFKGKNVDTNVIAKYIDKSQRVANLAKAIAAREGLSKIQCDSAQLAGSMIYLGHMLVASYFSDEYDQVVSLSVDLPLDERSCELETFSLGCRFNMLGAYLLGIWSLPDQVVEAVAFYTQPLESNNREFSPLTAVHIAESIVETIEKQDALNDNLIRLDSPYLSSVNSKTGYKEWENEAQLLFSNQVDFV